MIGTVLEERSGFDISVFVAPDAASASAALAAEVARVVSGAGGGSVNLALATGNTMLQVYAELTRLHREAAVSFSAVSGFQLDEYLGLGEDDRRSFRMWLQEHLLSRVDFDSARLHAHDTAGVESGCAAPDEYEQKIEHAGGVDLCLLGIGANGHVAFNEPGSAPDSRTRIVELAAPTRAAAADEFGSLDAVPQRAVTLGIANLLECRSLRLLALGQGKAEAVRRFLLGPIGSDVPASLLRAHSDLTVILDREAAALLPE